MYINEILTEDIKVRIDHPEDLVWQRGSLGIKNAISALQYVANNPNSVHIKWDGSPAILFGRNESGELIVTDKSGFNAKRYQGKAKSQEELYNILYNRNPTQPGRREFAMKIASLWPYFLEIVPESFRGFLQGDLLYVGTPPVENGRFVFMPNKVKYSVPVNSDIGLAIAASKAGIVVHSYYKDETVAIPDAVTGNLGLNETMDFLVLGNVPVTVAPLKIKIDVPETEMVDQFLDPISLQNEKISELKDLIGKFIASMAAQGISDYRNVTQRFKDWVGENAKRPETIKLWIDDHQTGYINMWSAIARIAAIKTYIKSQFDQSPQYGITALLNGKTGHEGYVADTPAGKIKLVDRFIFMSNPSRVFK